MKSLGVVAIVIIASWCASCENVSAQVPGAAPVNSAASPSGDNSADTDPVTGLPINPATGLPVDNGTASDSPGSGSSATPGSTPVPKPRSGSEQAVINAHSVQNAHLATPEGEIPVTNFPALRQFLEDSQNAHDKMIVDRFLIGVAILFAVIAAALLFSLPPKPREQKE